MQPIISIRNLSKKFRVGKVYVRPLRGVNLEIFPGEFLIIHGPSGSGKTTLLNMMAGLDKFESGNILIREKSINKMNETELARYRRSGIGMVFQNFNLISSINTWENVALPLQFSGVPTHERYLRAKELLEIVGLKDRAKHFARELSGGEQQRVAIARAMATNPQILLVDEPTGNLDSASGIEIIRLLKELNQKFGRTIVLVTHNQEYLVYATRVLLMQDGTIVGQKKFPAKETPEAAHSFKLYAPSKLHKDMRIRDILNLSFHHFRFSRTRTFLTVLGMTVGVAAIVLFVSLGFGLQKITTSSLASVQDLETLTVTPPDSGNVKINDDAINQIKKMDNVDLVAAQIDLTAMGQISGTSTGVTVKGIAPEDLAFDQINITSGKTFTDNNSAQAIVSSTALKSFDLADSQNIVGQSVQLQVAPANENSDQTPKTVEVKIVGVSGEKLTPDIYLPLGYTKTQFPGDYSSLEVKVKDTSKIQDLKTQIENLGFSVSAISGLIDQINKAFLIIEIVLGLIGGIALIVASFGIINTMTISLLERTHEIGIMRALGISIRDVKRLFTYEACLFGFFGGLTGIALGWLTGLGIDKLVAYAMRRGGGTDVLMPFITPYKFAILIFVFAIIIARLAGVYPAWSAARRSPLDALRYE